MPLRTDTQKAGKAYIFSIEFDLRNALRCQHTATRSAKRWYLHMKCDFVRSLTLALHCTDAEHTKPIRILTIHNARRMHTVKWLHIDRLSSSSSFHGKSADFCAIFMRIFDDCMWNALWEDRAVSLIEIHVFLCSICFGVNFDGFFWPNPPFPWDACAVHKNGRETRPSESAHRWETLCLHNKNKCCTFIVERVCSRCIFWHIDRCSRSLLTGPNPNDEVKVNRFGAELCEINISVGWSSIGDRRRQMRSTNKHTRKIWKHK